MNLQLNPKPLSNIPLCLGLAAVSGVRFARVVPREPSFAAVGASRLRVFAFRGSSAWGFSVVGAAGIEWSQEFQA